MTGRSLGMTGRSLGMTGLSLLLLVASCGKEEVVRTPEPEPEEDPWTELCGDQPIRFRTSLEEPVTKTPLEDMGGTNFRVFCFYQQGNIDPDPGEHYVGAWENLDTKHWTANFMYDEEVTYDNEAHVWTYSPVKYWPNNEENTLTFWAYSPHYNSDIVLCESGRTASDLYDDDVPGLPDVQFTTDGSRDLLISDLAQDLSYRGGDPATVDLLFHHAMCWVDFTVTKVDPESKYDMYIQSISLIDIYGTAIYRQSSARWLSPSGATGSISVLSTDLDDPGDLGYPYGYELSHSTPIDFPPKDGSGNPVRQVMPLPQRLTASGTNTPRIRVVYAYKIHDDSGDPPVTAPAAEFPLGTIPGHTRWDKEKHYTYNIHISPGVPLLFTASVENWDTEQNGYFNVYE